jgi:hypothetical protein
MACPNQNTQCTTVMSLYMHRVVEYWFGVDWCFFFWFRGENTGDLDWLHDGIMIIVMV